MSLQEWAHSGWLRCHRTSRQEISGLWGIIDRDLEASELLEYARGLRDAVHDWLRAHRPELVP